MPAAEFISFNPFAAGYTYLTNTELCRKPEKCLKPWHMGTHRRVLRESYPMHTNMTGFRWFCILVLWTKVALALVDFEDKDFIIKLFLKFTSNHTTFLIEDLNGFHLFMTTVFLESD